LIDGASLPSQSYPMRMAIVEMIGALIREVALSEEGEKEDREKKIKSLFELLTERFLDLSSYVRAKVINTLSKLCECVAIQLVFSSWVTQKLQHASEISSTTFANDRNGYRLVILMGSCTVDSSSWKNGRNVTMLSAKSLKP